MDTEQEPSAGETLAQEPETITAPMASLPGCRVGDKYTVKAVDGDTVTLEVEASESTEDWGGDLAKAAPANSEGM